MSINILDSFNYKGRRPDFVRQQFGTLAAMKAFSENYLPDMYLCFCLETEKVYLYNKNNTVDEVTGRWRELEGGGGGGGDLSNYYTKTETNTLLNGKQDTLEYDTVATSGSTNVMTSGAIYLELIGKMNNEPRYAYPVEGSTGLYTAGGAYTEATRIDRDQADQNTVINFLLNGTVKNIVKPSFTSRTVGTVSFEVGSDGKVHITGPVATGSATFRLAGTSHLSTDYDKQIPIPAGSYTLSVSGGSASTYAVVLGLRSRSDGTRAEYTVYNGTKDFTISTDTARYDLSVVSYSQDPNFTATVDPMICLIKCDDKSFQPYAPTNRELYLALEGKQGTLTFDTTPTSASTNPVTSGGIYTALSGKQDTLEYDASPTSGSTKMVKSGGIYNAISASVADKVEMGDVFGQGTQFTPTSSNHIDLNNYLTEDKIGVYYTSSSTATNNLDNCPITGVPIRMEVTKTGSFINQTIYANTTSAQRIFRRTASTGTPATIGDWMEFNTTTDISSVLFGKGTRIQGTSAEHENLDRYWMAGTYHILTGGDVANVDNTPCTIDTDIAGVRAKILVIVFSGSTEDDTRCVQIYIPQRLTNTAGTGVAYFRYRTATGTSPNVSISWTGWFRVDGTLLAAAAATT